MFQWQETFHEGRGNERAYYTYCKIWSELPVDSTQFRNAGFDNPSLFSWPYRSNSLQGKDVQLGEYSLQPGQVSKLGKFS